MTDAVRPGRAQRVRAFVRLGRPLFLIGGFVFFGLGTVAAAYDGHPLNLAAFLWGQAAVTAAQLMTHFSNEYYDLAADRANRSPTRWSGGSRVLPEGLLEPPAALIAALACGAIAIAVAIAASLAARPALLALPLLLLGTAIAWSYSAPPLRLHSTGLGELSVALLVPGLTTLIGYLLQAGEITLLPVLAALPLCLLQFAQMITISLPDVEGDASAGKRTLVVRVGARRASRLHNAALIGACALLPLLAVAGLPLPVAGLALLPLPVGVWQVQRMARGAWADLARAGSLAFWGIGLLMASAVLELLAFLALVI